MEAHQSYSLKRASENRYVIENDLEPIPRTGYQEMRELELQTFSPWGVGKCPLVHLERLLASTLMPLEFSC